MGTGKPPVSILANTVPIMPSTTKHSIQNVITEINSDPFGAAILDYTRTQKNSSIVVHSPLFEDDIIDVQYLFRKIDAMPNIEQKALALCRGRVLDVGAGSGCHTLELQKCGFDVEAIDISMQAVDAMRIRGVKHVTHASILDLKGQYDTILLLMNGIGMAGTISGLQELLRKLHSLLREGGSVILDSSDISYLYESEDGSFQIDLNAGYYGEIDYQMSYGLILGKPFKWLYVDFDTLSYYSSQFGFKQEFVRSGEDGYSYLAALKKL